MTESSTAATQPLSVLLAAVAAVADDAPVTTVTATAPKTMSEEERIFLAMDLTKAESYTAQIPLIKNRGQARKVPIHLLASTRNPFATVREIQRFRTLGQALQKLAADRWLSLKPEEQAVFKLNLKHLMRLRKKILRKKVAWNDVATPVTLGDLPKIAKHTRCKHPFSSPVGGPPAHKRLLNCTLFMEQRSGSPEVSRQKVAALAGIESASLRFVLCKLKKAGLIEYSSTTTIRLTPQGRAMADPGEAPSDNASVQQDLKRKFALKGKAAGLFDLMLDGRVHDRTALAAQAGITSKATLYVTVSKMKTQGIVETPDSKTIQLPDMCFPLGRPCEACDV